MILVVGSPAALGPLLMFVGKAMVFFSLFGDKLGLATKAGGGIAGEGCCRSGYNCRRIDQPCWVGCIGDRSGLIAIFAKLGYLS